VLSFHENNLEMAAETTWKVSDFCYACESPRGSFVVAMFKKNISRTIWLDRISAIRTGMMLDCAARLPYRFKRAPMFRSNCSSMTPWRETPKHRYLQIAFRVFETVMRAT
jgi:hypothetical protein